MTEPKGTMPLCGLVLFGLLRTNRQYSPLIPLKTSSSIFRLLLVSVFFVYADPRPFPP